MPRNAINMDYDLGNYLQQDLVQWPF